jgi:antitoxin (DNA-binding transcriptional repressor) of toxin-antitoxin stability system
MLYEVDIAEAPGRFAEMLETIAAGYGVLLKRGEAVICRLVPESAFAADAAERGDDAELTPEQRHAKDVLAAFQSMMNDEF